MTHSQTAWVILMCAMSSSVFAQSAASGKILDSARKKGRLVEGKPVVGAQPPGSIGDEAKKQDRPVEGKPVVGAQPPGSISDEAKKTDREVIAFPLVCRGGKGIRFKLSATPRGGLIWVSFLRGNGPASAGLLPGHCSWQDRGLRDGEPLKVCHEVPSFEVGFAAEATSVTVASSQHTFTHDMSDNYLGDLRLDKVFTFNVFNDGNGCLKVFSLP